MHLDNDEIKKTLSKNVQLARTFSNLTQEQLSELSHVSTNHIKNIEGGRSVGSSLTLIQICQALDITLNDLFKDFFRGACVKSENLVQQINLLNDYQKDIIYTLIQYFNNNDMHNKL